MRNIVRLFVPERKQIALMAIAAYTTSRSDMED